MTAGGRRRSSSVTQGLGGAAVLAASRRMKIPCPQDLSSDAHMPDVRMVSLELTSPRLVLAGPDIDSAVSLPGEPIQKLEFEIGNLLVLAVGEIPLPLVSLSHDHSVHHSPGLVIPAGHFLPSLKSLTVEDGLETIVLFIGLLASVKQSRAEDHDEREETGQRVV